MREWQFHPLTPGRWDDFVALFGANEACGGCWCMSWRLTKSAFEAGKGEANMRAMWALVDSGEPLGILGYRKGQPIAWCSVAPRETFPRVVMTTARL
jgi:hypothetical protein